MKSYINIYIDLTAIIKSRINTGIQRVVKEFLQRTLETTRYENIKIHYIAYDIEKQTYNCYIAEEINTFLNNIKAHQLNVEKTITLSNKEKEISILFDMDAVWNIHTKRIHLYPELKKNNFYIVNFLYDLSPILLPQYSHVNTCRNFISFMSAVYEHSDMVFFDSLSAEQDFLRIKKQAQVTREIPTRVTGLGADFAKKKVATAIKDKNKNLRKKKYILFVGTIEPRKDQKIVLDSFNELSKKYPDLNLVFIGKQGWRVEEFIEKIQNHKLKDKRFFYFDDISDEVLEQFYTKAWIVIYLSKHEGYGLPIAESLSYGNITIASKNSSMYEVGENFTDYVVYGAQNEIIDTVSFYYDNPEIYTEKKQLIKNKFTADTWGRLSVAIMDVFQQFPRTLKMKNTEKPENIPFVLISSDVKKVKEVIQSVDKYIDFVEEYIIITPAQKINKIKSISSQNKIRVVDEKKILKNQTGILSKSTPAQKRWLLTTGIPQVENLAEEFIILNENNLPLTEIDKEYFVSPEGRYNAYYFFDLLKWNSRESEYDKKQQNLKEILSKKKYELLSYSSHAPQIINKKLFSEMAEEFFEMGMNNPIDEWSAYFNYSISKYPYLFNKKTFNTLYWPLSPTDWAQQYAPGKYLFENLNSQGAIKNYKGYHKLKYMFSNITSDEKVELNKIQVRPYNLTNDIFKTYNKYLAERNEIYGCISFLNKELDCHLFSIPKKIITLSSAQVRLTMNCKVLNHNLTARKLEIYYLIKGKESQGITIDISSDKYFETIIELPISTRGLRNKEYILLLDIKINGKAIYKKTSPYSIKLTNFKTAEKVILPEGMKIKDVGERGGGRSKVSKIKHKIVSIPYLGKSIYKAYKSLT